MTRMIRLTRAALASTTQPTTIQRSTTQRTTTQRTTTRRTTTRRSTTRRTTILRTTSLLAASLLVASGCGGSTKPLTRAQLIAKADPICRTVVRTVDYAKLTPAIIVRFASRLANVEERAYTALSRLTPPMSILDDWQFIVDGFRESAKDFRELERTPHPDGERGRFESLYGAVRGKAWTAREDGFKDCGEY